MTWSSVTVLSLAGALVLCACSDDGMISQAESTSGATQGSATSSSTTSTTSTTDDGLSTTSSTGPSSTSGTSGRGDTDSATGTDSGSTGKSTTDTGSTGEASTGSTGGSTESTGTTGDTTGTGGGNLLVGEECSEDAECQSGVCWDYSDYDPFCFGAVCSVTCQSDDDCYTAFDNAGAPYPENSVCGNDGRCNPLATGFGLFACQ